MDSTLFSKLALSLAIGFLIGIERGWKQRDEAPGERAAGLRTYALAGLLGGIAALVGQELGALSFAAIALAFVGVFGLFIWRETAADQELSATGAVAGLVTFALGALATVGSSSLAASAAVAVVLVLAFKDALHAWLKALTWVEIRSALFILAMSLIALPLMPSGPIDPWGLFDARALWLLTILIAVASFAGYVAVKMFGARTGLALGAAAGAIVSSTIVTIDLARRVKAKEALPLDAAAGAAIASAVMLARVGVLTFAMSPAILTHMLPTLAAVIGAAGIAALALFLLDGWRSGPNSFSALKSPLDLRAVLRFALVLSVLSILAQLATRAFGSSAILPVAAFSGLVDVDAVILAVSRLPESPAPIAADAILLAVMADTLLKCVLALFIGGAHFGGLYTCASLAMLAAGVAARFLL